MSTLQFMSVAAVAVFVFGVTGVILTRRKMQRRQQVSGTLIENPVLTASALQFVNHALNAHGIPSVIKDGATRVIAATLSLEPKVFEQQRNTPGSVVQLDVYARASQIDPRFILESFAGVGESPSAALQDAIQKFLSSTFHVLVTALAGHHCESEQTEWMDWARGDAAWRVCGGPLLVHGDAPTTTPYHAFFSELEKLYRARAQRGTHWVRVFVASLNGEMTAGEVMLDNEPWSDGEALVRQWNWQHPAGYRSIRHFFIALTP